MRKFGLECASLYMIESAVGFFMQETKTRAAKFARRPEVQGAPTGVMFGSAEA